MAAARYTDVKRGTKRGGESSGSGIAPVAIAHAEACSHAGIDAFAPCRSSTTHTTSPAHHSRESCATRSLYPGRRAPPAAPAPASSGSSPNASRGRSAKCDSRPTSAVQATPATTRVVFASRSTENSVNGASAPAPAAAASAETAAARATASPRLFFAVVARAAKATSAAAVAANRPENTRRSWNAAHSVRASTVAAAAVATSSAAFFPRLRGVACRFGAAEAKARKARRANHAGSVKYA